MFERIRKYQRVRSDVHRKVREFARLSTVKHILDYAGWSEHIGGNYRYSATPVNHVLPEEQSKTVSSVSKEREFYHWLESSGMLTSDDCNRYTSGINAISKFLNDECNVTVDMYAIGDLKTISDYFAVAAKNPAFVTLARNQKDRFFASVKLYTDYLAAENAKIKTTSSVTEYIPNTSQIPELEAYIKAAEKGVSFGDIKDTFPVTKRKTLMTMLEAENIVYINGKYYCKENIEDFDEAAETILSTVQNQFRRNDGYTSAKMLYDELRIRLEDFFFNNNGEFDSAPELYDLTKHLFEKIKYKGNSYVFAENKHIWEHEPDYEKSYFGILSAFAKRRNGIITRDEMLEYLTAMGSDSPMSAFSNLMLKQNPVKKTFLMYDEYRYVLTAECHIDDLFVSSLKMRLEELLESDDYLIFDDIDEFFYTTLPELLSGVNWSVHMIKSVLSFFDVGFSTVAVGGNNDIKIPDAAIVRKNSIYKSFGDILWSEINREYELPREFGAEEFRRILLRKGFIREHEKTNNVHTTVKDDLRYFWTDNNGKVIVSKK